MLAEREVAYAIVAHDGGAGRTMIDHHYHARRDWLAWGTSGDRIRVCGVEGREAIGQCWSFEVLRPRTRG
jgi:hypothetical protein